MAHFHDPIRQIGYLQQSLSQDKRPLSFFLGAGCPLSIRDAEDRPLIPDISGMTRQVNCELAAAEDIAEVRERVAQHFSDGKPNIEKMLGYIRTMKQVVEADSSWDLAVNELDSCEKTICNCIYNLVDKVLPSRDTPYHRLASWAASADRTEPVEFFTTNYDLLLEQALEECRVPFFDGFVGSRNAFFDLTAMEEDRLPPRWARVWKLHGSINWRKDETGAVIRGDHSDNQEYPLIHPSHLKYEESRRMPYLAMIDRLKAFFRKPSAVLVLCGYSFGDQHLNEVIVQGLRSNPTTAAFALLYGTLSKYPEAIRLASVRPNLSLFSSDEAIIGGKRASWPSCENPDPLPYPEFAEWTQTDEGKKHLIFKLGDFRKLGQFLLDLMGSNGEKALQNVQ